MRRLSEHQLVQIEWEDAEHEGAWSEPDVEDRYEIAPCVSVGWIISENAKRVVLSASVALTEEREVREVGNKQIIPIGMIVKRKILKEASNGRRRRRIPDRTHDKNKDGVSAGVGRRGAAPSGAGVDKQAGGDPVD